ncbi:hypothetical protein ACFLZ7_02775 [Nanoarchaeota archaeon]
MIEEIRQTILDILNEVVRILEVKEEKDVFEIRGLSDRTIRYASIYQDKDAISIAVVVYALFKIIERQTDMGSKVYTLVLSHLKKAKKYLWKSDFEKYGSMMRGLLKEIAEIDRKLKVYIIDVIEKAKLKKGSKIYEQGVSIGRAAELMGISQWELLSYVGKTEIAEEVPKVTSIKGRLNLVRRMFNL